MIVALCPTYRRRRLLANSVACFLAQTNQESRLLIFDDSGEHGNQQGERWQLIEHPPFQTLADKYNLLAQTAIEIYAADSIAVWEDDDIYGPYYLEYHARALELNGAGWSHCNFIWESGNAGRPVISAGRHPHGHTAMSRQIYQRVGGWPSTAEANYDSQLLACLRATGPPQDPGQFGTTQHYFRWSTSGEPHGQAYIKSHADTGWLARAQAAISAKHGPVIRQPPLAPELDIETGELFRSALFDSVKLNEVLVVRYGQSNSSDIDITNRVRHLCASSAAAGRWSMPDNDEFRAGLFGDPYPGVTKKVYVRLFGNSDSDEFVTIESWERIDFIINEEKMYLSQQKSKKAEAERSLRSRYHLASEKASDINQHLPLLLGYTKQCSSVVECGVRYVCSSYAFAVGLQGRPENKFTLIDPYKSPFIDAFVSLCYFADVDAHFVHGSDLDCQLVDADLLFIDTWHVYAQLRRELARWQSCIKKFIIIHDTSTDGLRGESVRSGLDIKRQSLETGFPEAEIAKGLWPAIEEFLESTPGWVLDLRMENNNGLTILRRRGQ
jgi:hypothetical protein